ncbi:MAG: NAD(P)H-dependent oxidoreductase subunit E, partial [Candidatus Zixiibacteriota bacterium]
PMIVEEFERQLGVGAGNTTSDNEFTLETVNCLGACALGPIVVVDGHYYSKVNTAKVKRILTDARRGVKQAKINGDRRVFALEVNCPHCNHSLTDTTHLVDEQPSIRLTASFADKHGWIRLSRLYGSYNVKAKYDIPDDTIVHFFCPHCHAELAGAYSCVECGAPMVPMIVRSGGMVQICSRRGCKNHMLDLDGVNL